MRWARQTLSRRRFPIHVCDSLLHVPTDAKHFCQLNTNDWLSWCATKACFLLYPSPPSAAYSRQWTWSALVQVMACRLFGAKPLPEPMLAYCQLDSWEQKSWKLKRDLYIFIPWNALENAVAYHGFRGGASAHKLFVCGVMIWSMNDNAYTVALCFYCSNTDMCISLYLYRFQVFFHHNILFMFATIIALIVWTPSILFSLTWSPEASYKNNLNQHKRNWDAISAKSV